VAGVSLTGRRLLQTGSVTATTPSASLCPYAQLADPLLPALVMPATVPPSVLDDLYHCPFNANCTRDQSLGVLANDTTPNAGGSMNNSWVAIDPPSGTLVLDRDGSFTYMPIS